MTLRASRYGGQAPTLIVVVAVLLLAAVGLQLTRERVYAQGLAEPPELLYVNSGTVMGKISLSYKSVVADAYWMRALQHFGRGHLNKDEPNRFQQLYPLLDLTTSLDPKFTVAYRFGAIFLSEPLPDGAGRPDLAVKLLQKGIAADPKKWEYFHDVGFVYYWHLHDYKSAAEWFQKGGAMPGSPWWLRTYAAIMLTRGGDRQASRFMWENILHGAEHGWLEQNARHRLAQLDALDQLDQLKQVEAVYRQRYGRLPGSWPDLFNAGLLRGVPLDPSGTPYAIFPDGRITLEETSNLYPLPTEPVAGQPPAL